MAQIFESDHSLKILSDNIFPLNDSTNLSPLLPCVVFLLFIFNLSIIVPSPSNAFLCNSAANFCSITFESLRLFTS